MNSVKSVCFISATEISTCSDVNINVVIGITRKSIWSWGRCIVPVSQTQVKCDWNLLIPFFQKCVVSIFAILLVKCWYGCHFYIDCVCPADTKKRNCSATESAPAKRVHSVSLFSYLGRGQGYSEQKSESNELTNTHAPYNRALPAFKEWKQVIWQTK